jgi:small multidrug resistance family-3 protein
MQGGRSPLLLAAAAVCLALFAWLLAFHPNAGRAYAAYGGVYVTCAVCWSWLVEQRTPDRWDLVGAAVAVVGMLIISFGPRP